MSSLYIHDNEFDALRQKAIRYLKEFGKGKISHSTLLRYMHVDADTFRRIIDTLLESDMLVVKNGPKGGNVYILRMGSI